MATPITVEIIIIIMLVVYGLIVSYMLYDYYRNNETYLKDKVDYVNNKTIELASRERLLTGRETCDRDLTRLKTIHKSALDVLSAYNTITNPI